ncbi:transposable element Tc1 transposase [Trichonephila clavipes]|nr:transposable element Tc1 transposase [Trichonephila clavipes]
MQVVQIGEVLVIWVEAMWQQCWQQRVDSGIFQRHDGNGRPRATADREDRFITSSAVKAPDSLLSTIRPTLPALLACIFLARLQSCLARSGWHHSDWGFIVFSDESRFQMRPGDHSRHVWGHPGKHADPALSTTRYTGYQSGVMSLVYADKPQTLDHLEDNIRRVIADIRPQMLEKVIENWMSRLDYIRASCGSPMPEIIIKIFEDQQPASKAPSYIWLVGGKGYFGVSKFSGAIQGETMQQF